MQKRKHLMGYLSDHKGNAKVEQSTLSNPSPAVDDNCLKRLVWDFHSWFAFYRSSWQLALFVGENQ